LTGGNGDGNEEGHSNTSDKASNEDMITTGTRIMGGCIAGFAAR